MNLLKNFCFPALEVIASLALAFLPIFIGVWLRDALANVGEPPTFRLALGIMYENLTNIHSPVPYFVIAVIISLCGRVDGFINRYYAGSLKAAQIELQREKDALREEAQAHADSKSSYLKTLGSALKYLLTSQETGFDHRCRITIYRRQLDQDRYLRQIFRHSPNKGYEDNGRFRIPMDEGIVGAAWGNHGEMEFSMDADPSSKEFADEMRRKLEPENCLNPDVEFSMPSRHYFARAFDDHETGNRVGVVIYESTEVQVLSSAGIATLLDTQKLDVSRFIRLLGILHREFSPDPEEDQV